eukprot:COSAG02_NODE_257_length_26838_cov_118.324844_3_plen_45_part_00
MRSGLFCSGLIHVAGRQLAGSVSERARDAAAAAAGCDAFARNDV